MGGKGWLPECGCEVKEIIQRECCCKNVCPIHCVVAADERREGWMTFIPWLLLASAEALGTC